MARAHIILRLKRHIFTVSGHKYLCLCVFRNAPLLRLEKKDTVVCLADARSLLRPEKKVLVICLAGARSLLQLEKKVLVI